MSTAVLIVFGILFAIAALGLAFVWLLCRGRGLDRVAARPAIVAAGVLLALAVLSIGSAFAQSGGSADDSGRHGDGHAQQHDIYKDWKPPNNAGTSCCSAAQPDGSGDCRPTRAYMGDDGLWRAWNGYLWLTVPPERLLPPDFAGDGRSHLCEKATHIYCFTPGQVRG